MSGAETFAFTVPPRHYVVGVDFSGAVDAHRRIWMCSAERTGLHAVKIDGLHSLEDIIFPDEDRSQESAYAVLRERLSWRPHALIGIDAPFSLPEAALNDGETWEEFVDGFEARFPSPDSFRDAMRARFDGKELKRACDVAAKTPWCAWNLRLYRQTWHAIANVIAPMVRDGQAWCPPMQEPLGERPALIEACPAAALKARNAYLPGYKGAGDKATAARAEILSRLELDGMSIGLEDARKAVLDAGGDALDSVVAAVAVANASSRTLTVPAAARREAWVVA